MNINENEIAALVQQVLSEMTGAAAPSSTPATPAKASGSIPKTARVAMLTDLKKFEIREYPIPEVGDDDILVKVEGCGVCGTDAHEFKVDPFSLIPVVLGHEGTGEIVKMGKNVKIDSAGKPLKVGDKVVTIGGICGKVSKIKDNFVILETGNVGTPDEKSFIKMERDSIKSVETKQSN